jgi:hypothetical protein
MACGMKLLFAARLYGSKTNLTHGVTGDGGLCRLDRLPYRHGALCGFLTASAIETIVVDQAHDAGFDLADERADGEDQRRMELHEAGARTDLRIGVFGTHDHGEVDQRHALGSANALPRTVPPIMRTKDGR